ncbi:MAG: hypothetical protein M1837_005942 [Sclerophora amabilis]|nr:MAG: hypothetical protein M1837_005942 [Sclerophora amabilis]
MNSGSPARKGLRPQLVPSVAQPCCHAGINAEVLVRNAKILQNINPAQAYAKRHLAVDTNALRCAIQEHAHHASSVVRRKVPSDVLFAMHKITLQRNVHQSLCGEVCPRSCPQCVTNTFSERVQLGLECGHIFDLSVIDGLVGMRDFYEMDDTGVITGMIEPTRDPREVSLLCPQCGSLISGVRRYTRLYQLQSLWDTMDRLAAKMDRKLGIFERRLANGERRLNASFKEFCSGVRPNPLAAKSHSDSIIERGRWYTQVQMAICHFRDDVAMPSERDLERVETSVYKSHFARVPILPFSLRFDLLFWQCRLATLKEAIRTTGFLASLVNAPEHIGRLAQGLRGLISEQGQRMIGIVGERIDQCVQLRLPCLEIEFCLVQASLHVVAKKVDALTNFDFDKCMVRAIELCHRYPSTAGKFQHLVTVLRRANGNAADLPATFDMIESKSKRRWGRYVVGHLKLCENGHPFSSVGSEGCLECGREVPSATDHSADYSMYMKNDDFVKWMEGSLK